MPPFFRGNPTFFAVMGGVVLIQILIVQYGGAVFGTVPLSAGQWAKIIVVSASVLIVGFVMRVSYRYLNGKKKQDSG